MILAIDTSGLELVLCLLDDGLAVAAESVTPGPRHQDGIVDAVSSVLGGPASVAGLAAIAVVRGPGSQTGLRVGLSTAAGMAFAGRVALLPLSSLAVAARRAAGEADVVPVVSAGRTNVYAQLALGGTDLSGPRVLCDLAEVHGRLGLDPGLALVGEAALMARAGGAAELRAGAFRGSTEALAAATRAALGEGVRLAYHELNGDYGEP